MSIFDTAKDAHERSQGAGSNNTAPQNNDPAAGIFDRIGKADVSRQGVYPLPGIYPVLYIDVVKMFRNRKGADLFTVEFLVLESQVIDRPAGSKMTWQTNMQNDAGPGNARGFIAAAMGCTVEEVTGHAASLTCSAENPCHGRLIRLLATNVKTRADKDFTVCEWIPLASDSQAQAETVRESVFPN